MPDDIYSALIGGVPTDPQRQAALADAIRRQAYLGQLGMASGDRVLEPLGRGLLGESDKQGDLLMRDRESLRALEATKAWRDAMLGERQTHHQNQDTVAVQRAANDAIRAGAAQQNADTRRDNPPGSKPKPPKPIPTAELKDLETMQDSLAGVKGAIESYKPGYGGTGRNYANSLAATVPALATENAKAAQNWWANYGRQFTLPELKATIGIRHNQYMQHLFESYHLDPNMNDQQLTTNLGQIHGQLRNRIVRRITDLKNQGYDVGGFEPFLAEGGAPQAGGAPRAGDKYLPKSKPTAMNIPQVSPDVSQPVGGQPQQIDPRSLNLFSGIQYG